MTQALARSQDFSAAKTRKKRLTVLQNTAKNAVKKHIAEKNTELI